MSGLGNHKKSLLPEDIEARLAEVQNTISTLEGKVNSLYAEVEVKENELKLALEKIDIANAQYANTIEGNEKLLLEIKDREVKVAQRESAMNVYASALEEKEKKINKYLAIFENMRDVIKK